MYHFTVVDNPAEREQITENAQTPFVTLDWLRFVCEYSGAKPYIIKVSCSENYLGYLCGAMIKKGPIKIFGSPFIGWRAPYMGFSMEQQVDFSSVLDQAIDYISNELGCHYITFCDRNISSEIINASDHKFILGDCHASYYIDLTKSEEELLGNFRRDQRQNVAKFAKTGCKVEEDYSDLFIRTHLDQFKEVYARHGLAAPDYTRKTEAIFKNTADKMLLSIKALSPEGMNIATSYYVYYNTKACFLGNASYSEYLGYRPNQALMWHAIKYLKRIGVETLDLNGRDGYKANYGGEYVVTPSFIYTKYRWIYSALHFVPKAYHSFLELRHFLKN